MSTRSTAPAGKRRGQGQLAGGGESDRAVCEAEADWRGVAVKVGEAVGEAFGARQLEELRHLRPGDCVAIEVDEQAAGKGPDVPVGDAVGRGELRSTRRARSRSLRRPAWRNRVRPGRSLATCQAGGDGSSAGGRLGGAGCGCGGPWRRLIVHRAWFRSPGWAFHWRSRGWSSSAREASARASAWAIRRSGSMPLASAARAATLLVSTDVITPKPIVNAPAMQRPLGPGSTASSA